MARLIIAVRALLIAIAGSTAAWAYGRGESTLLWGLAIAAMVIGLIGEILGHAALPEFPRIAIWFLELAFLVPLTIAIMICCGAIVIGAAFLVSANAPPLARQISAFLVAGITAFISAAVIALAGDDNEFVLAAHIKRMFYRYYVRSDTVRKSSRALVFDKDSPVERWVHSDSYGGITGWGFKARRTRAKGLAAEIAGT